MAASGTITINLKSIDYVGRLPSGTCYTAANAGSFGRGSASLDTTVNWTINDSNLLSFSDGGSTGSTSWYVCSTNGYTLEIQFSEDQVNWTTIASSHTDDYTSCIPSETVVGLAHLLITELQPVILTKSGYIRVYTWTNNACPTSELPNAYPTQSGSQAVAVPIYIEVDYRPGAVRKSGVFTSTNNDGGACHLLKNGTWTEMKTQDGGTGVDNPPSIRRSGAWKNQNKIGA